MRTETDAELIKAYAERNDQGAFAEIISRHGAMVYRACFRTLVNRHDSEDASQAVFMTLIKNSEKIKWKNSLACWLYAVARQTALFMARSRARREQREAKSVEILDDSSNPQICHRDQETLLGILDKELAALSAIQREAVILRYFDGLSEKDAALAVGCAPHTLSCRASDGISKLRNRLLSRRCTLGIPALVAFLEADAQAAVPQTLIPSLLAVPKLAAAGAAAGKATANIINIMEGTVKIMAITKIKVAGVGILIALLIGTSAVVAVKEFQKRQNAVIKENPEIVNSNEKQKVPVQPESSYAKASSSPKNDDLTSKKLEQKAKPSAVKQAPNARDFQAEVEKAVKEENWETLKKIIAEWIEIDPFVASEWVLKLPPEGKGYWMATPVAIYNLAEKDPVAAAEWALRFPKPPEGVPVIDALAGVSGVWAQKDPAAAAEWALSRYPDNEGKDSVLASVALEWAKKDSVAVSEWILQMPEERRKNVLIMVSSDLVLTDLAAASEWALKLSEAEGRNEQLASVVQIWAKKNQTAAKEWIENSPLPPEVKDKLLKEMEKK